MSDKELEAGVGCCGLEDFNRLIPHEQRLFKDNGRYERRVGDRRSVQVDLDAPERRRALRRMDMDF